MDIIVQSLIAVFSPITFLLIIAGTLFGMICGALPGLSSSMAIILCLPFTYSMDPIAAIVLMVAVYVGGATGGSISAILLKTPGTPEAVATTFDGYPMAQNGRAGEALGLAVTASSFGTIFSAFVMLVASPALAVAALSFQSAEYFGLGLIGLSCITSIGAKNQMKAVLSVLLGLMISTIGLDSINGVERFAFEQPFLLNGINYISVMIGAFAIGEVYKNIEEYRHRDTTLRNDGPVKVKLMRFGEMARMWSSFVKGSIIGTIIGITPGPLLLKEQPIMLNAIFLSLIAAALLLFIGGRFVTSQFGHILKLPYPLLGSLIVALGLVGAYSLKNSLYDVIIMFAFGLIGYLFDKFKYSSAAVILGLILGDLIENSLRKQIIIGDGSGIGFLTRPVSLVILATAILTFLWPMISARRAKRAMTNAE